MRVAFFKLRVIYNWPLTFESVDKIVMLNTFHWKGRPTPIFSNRSDAGTIFTDTWQVSSFKLAAGYDHTLRVKSQRHRNNHFGHQKQ